MFVSSLTVPYSVSLGLLYVFFILFLIFIREVDCCAPLLAINQRVYFKNVNPPVPTFLAFPAPMLVVA